MPEPMSARIPVLEIAQRLRVGKRAVYAMLERRQMPGLRVGRKWIVTRHAYEQWERTMGQVRGAA
jgi:excisionase family DNA binding protein